MDFIERYKLDMKNIEKLRNILEEKNGVVAKYNAEIQPLKEQIAEIGKKYNIESVKKEISDIEKELKKPTNSFYVTFLKEILRIAELVDEEGLDFDIEDFFDNTTDIWLNSDFENIGVGEDTYVEDNSIYGFDETDWMDVEIVDFDHKMSVEELDVILKKIYLCIECEKLLKTYVDYMDNKFIIDKLNIRLKKYDIECFPVDKKDSKKRIFDNMILIFDDSEDEEKYVAMSKNLTSTYFSFKKDINISELIPVITNEINSVLEEIEEDEEYKKFLELKEKFS